MLGDHPLFLRRGSLALGLRRTDPPPSPRQPEQSPAERFAAAWFARPADPHGLLLPQLQPSHLRLWRLYFLRWVAEAQIPGGGPVAAFRAASRLADEIEALRLQLRRYQGPGPAPNPGPAPGHAPDSAPNPGHAPGHAPQPEPRRMYFAAGDSPSPPPTLSSSFPFSSVGNLSRGGALGTPFSKFLNGAKIWLSTETLASETL